jgi:catechol 2,3-dioxygenase
MYSFGDEGSPDIPHDELSGSLRGDRVGLSRINHIALKVRELSASDRFYREVLGMEKVGERPRMWFYRASGQEHDLALFELGAAGKLPSPHHTGMFHLGFAVSSAAALAALYQRCQEVGVPILGAVEHAVMHTFYVQDPDGNTIELGVEAPQEDWTDSAAPFPA